MLSLAQMRDLPRDDLVRLPTVSRLAAREASFRDERQVRWAIGRSGDIWVKCFVGLDQTEKRVPLP